MPSLRWPLIPMFCLTCALHRVELARAQAIRSDAGSPSPEQAQQPASVTPPEPLVRVDAEYPAGALAARRTGKVTLQVTIESDGRVSDATVADSAGDDLDRAALDAVRQWRFRPALRGHEPVRARVRIPFQFALPAEPVPAPAPSPAEPAIVVPAAPSVQEVQVRGERVLRTEQRSASDFLIAREMLAAAPRQEGAEVLRAAPGVYIARGEGLAVAHRYMLRGFDADHGQDLELKVGGLPINLPSHLHGQGYADLGFVIADTVRSLAAREGVYDPRQGDFAVAGSIELGLGVAERGLTLKSGHGSFGTWRQGAVWAPLGLEPETFGAVQLLHTDGFGDNRRGDTASAIAQLSSGAGAWRQRALGIVYLARAELAGVLRQADVAAGRVDFYSVYPLATARAQNAFAARILSGAFADYRGAEGDTASLGVWLGLDDFRLQENFSGFSQHSQTLANVAGRGDLIEQRNRTRSLGIEARYRTRPYHAAPWAHGTLELGLSGRMDEIEQAQNLIDAVVRSQTWDRRVDAGILASDLGLWGDLDWRLTRHLSARVAARADVLAYQIDDRLGNRVTLTRPDDSFIVGFRRSALGIVAGPRASIEVRPLPLLSVRAAYGEGYRSPQARTLDDGEDAPFTKVRSADLGLSLGDPAEWQLTLASYYTRLSDDVAFEAEEGRLERIGATRRLGAVARLEAHPARWLLGAASLTYVDAELLEPPPATPEEPQPPFARGQNLPFVPPLVARVDLGASPTLLDELSGHALEARLGLGWSWLSPRPLPYGESSRAVSLLDASASLGWGALSLALEAFNLLDQRHAASELNFPSSWDPQAPRSRTPARHVAAGPPRTLLLTLGVSL
jgi:iron complex outermembrane receptor protein